MIVNNFYFARFIFVPYKANPVLVIDVDTVLAFSRPTQSFQTITRRNSQFFQKGHRIQLIQLARRDFPQSRRA